MRQITILILSLWSLVISAQQEDSPAIAFISAKSTAAYLGEMKTGLLDHGLIINVEREIWRNQQELQEFAFTITHPMTKMVKSYHFKFNDLNRHQMFILYPDAEQRYFTALTDISYLTEDLLSLLIPIEVKRQKPIIYKSYDRSGRLYREPYVKTELDQLAQKLEETITLHKHIRADQRLGRSLSGIVYTYNGTIVTNPKAINFEDMTADILIEKLSEEEMIINVWSEKPLMDISNGISMISEHEG